MAGRTVVSGATALALALGLTLGGPSVASAATTEDQVQGVVDEMFCFQPYVASACYNGAAQTVTAGVDGDLIAVSLVVEREAFTTRDLVVQIRSGDPNGAVLATSDPVAASDIPTSPNGDWVLFVFAAPASFTAGDVFAIVMPDMPPSDSSDPRWALGKATDDVYPGGVAFGGVIGSDWQEFQDGSDFAFVTYMASGEPTCDLAVTVSGGQPADELTVTVGDEVGVIGSDFGAFAPINLELAPPSGDPVQDTTDADVFGDFGGTVIFEAEDIGEWQISATSADVPDCSDAVAVTVVAATVSQPTPRPTVPPTTAVDPPTTGSTGLFAAVFMLTVAAAGFAVATSRIARRRS